jgi:D-ribose pyranose/furanose isomerase RbsD
MGTKTVNYTETQTAELVERYQAAETPEQRDTVVEELAQDMGKTVRSVRQKLVREGVYIAKEYKTKTGARPESKEKIVTDIAGTLGVAAESIESLNKANKTTLALIRTTLQYAKDALGES